MHSTLCFANFKKVLTIVGLLFWNMSAFVCLSSEIHAHIYTYVCTFTSRNIQLYTKTSIHCAMLGLPRTSPANQITRQWLPFF